MYQLLISILISLGILFSAEQFYQMTPAQQDALMQEHIIINIDEV